MYKGIGGSSGYGIGKIVIIKNDIPELFVGGHGTMGNGRYSIYDVDGNCFCLHWHRSVP